MGAKDLNLDLIFMHQILFQLGQFPSTILIFFNEIFSSMAREEDLYYYQ